MADYITKEQALLIIDRDKRDNLLMQAEIRHVRSADVIERSKVNKAIEELQNMKVYDRTRTARLVSLPEVFEILKKNIGE